MSESALKNRNYVIYLCGNVISLHGLWIYRVALGWFAWELSHSEFWIGVIAFTQFAPAVVFGPIFGVLADRFDRRAASLLINSVSVLNMVLLGWLTLSGQVDIVTLAILSMMQGTLDGAHMPVRMTIVPNLVNKGQLQSAIALTSVSFNLSRFVGPAIAGFIIAGYGIGHAFIINGITYLSLIAAMIVIRLNPVEERVGEAKNVWSDLVDGARYVFQHRQIRSLLIIVAVASVFGRGALEMMPAFADAVYDGGSVALAILTSAIGAGAIVAGLILSRGTHWLNVSVIRIAIAVSGALIAVLGLVDQFWLAVTIVALLGIILSMCGVGSQILIQTLVDDEVRGRVSSLWGVVAFGGTALGGLLVGATASNWDLQNAVFSTGLLCCAAALVSGILSSRTNEQLDNQS